MKHTHALEQVAELAAASLLYVQPVNERPYFCCGMMPSEGHTAYCVAVNGEG